MYNRQEDFDALEEYKSLFENNLKVAKDSMNISIVEPKSKV